MAFEDLADLGDALDGAHLDLPIDGKTYRVADVDAATGLWAQGIWARGQAVARGEQADDATLDDVAEADMYRRLLGETLDELVADSLPWSVIRRVGITTLSWVCGGVEAAQQVWQVGDDLLGEAQTPGPNRATRRASEAAARRSAAGTSRAGSTSPRKPAQRRQAAGTAGRKS